MEEYIYLNRRILAEIAGGLKSDQLAVFFNLIIEAGHPPEQKEWNKAPIVLQAGQVKTYPWVLMGEGYGRKGRAHSRADVTRLLRYLKRHGLIEYEREPNYLGGYLITIKNYGKLAKLPKEVGENGSR